MAGTPEGQGLIARVTTALRYALTGQSPDGWFGPLDPLPQQAPEDVRGRQFDYPVGANINYRPRGTEPLDFAALKRMATHPIVAMLIQRQKDLVCGQDWQIKPRLKSENDGADDPQIKTITDFLRYPDQEHDWCQWIGAVLDQMLVIDAVSIYAAPTRGGGVYALQILDGATIKPVINLSGRRPLAPDPAYQQVLKGLPAVDYTTDELVYFPQTYRADRFYGYSRVEQAADLITMAISRLRSQKGYFDFGNLGDGYFEAPQGMVPEQINTLEAKFNSMMQGVDPALRRASPFVPSGTKWNATKTEILSDQFDEFLIRLLCFPFGVAPQPFMKQTGMGHGSADTEHEAAEEGGIAPLLSYVERLLNLIIAKWFGRPDLEFAFVNDREFDPKTAAEIDDIKIKNGTLLRNEARDRDGLAPLEGGDVPTITAGATIARLQDVVADPEPIETTPAGTPGQPGTNREPSTAAAKGDKSSADDEESDLAKAADPARKHALSVLLASYLAGKGDAIATALADRLVKSDPSSDDQSGRIEQAIEDLDWDWSDLPGVVEPVIAGLAVTAGTEAVSQLGIFDAETLKRVSARSTAYAENRAAELVGMRMVDGQLVVNPDAKWSITETTRDMLHRSVTTAMAEGQSNTELAKTIREDTAFSKDRADMIARTETAMADVQGQIAGWKASGVVGGKQFLAAPDCCDDCQALDGQIVDLDEDFTEGDPPIHPNCRCDVIAVLTDDMPGGDDAED